MEQLNIRQRYNDTYYRRHKNQLNEKYWCATCGGFFTMPNKSNHLKQASHMWLRQAKCSSTHMYTHLSETLRGGIMAAPLFAYRPEISVAPVTNQQNSHCRHCFNTGNVNIQYLVLVT